MSSRFVSPSTSGNQKSRTPLFFSGYELCKSLCFLASIAGTTLIFGSCASLGGILYIGRKRRRTPLHFVGVRWAQSIIKLNPWWKFEVTGRENLPPDGSPVVFVSNHLSQADILAIYCLETDFRWLSKDSVFNVPFMGWGMKAIGYVPVKRGNRRSHKEAMNQSLAHLNQGTPMVFFPEGTRSRTGRLQNFKPGAFVLAHKAGVPIVPITIQGTEKLLRNKTLIPGEARVTVHVHPALNWQNGESVPSMMDRTRYLINESLPESMRFQEDAQPS